jgi:hypothetical protein
MMNTINDGGPAFPLATSSASNESVNGMSLRDWFAGMALQGMLAQSPSVFLASNMSVLEAAKKQRENVNAPTCEQWIAEWAVGFADAMLVELKKDRT